MNSLNDPTQERTHQLFHWMVMFALLGPTLGIKIGSYPNITFFRIAFFLLVVGVMIQWMKRRSLAATHMYPLRWYVVFFTVWLAYAAASLIWVGNLGFGIRYNFFLLTMMLITLSLPYFIKDITRMKQTSLVLLITFSLIVWFGLFEAITLWHLPASRYADVKSASVTSVFRNQNDLATAITLGLPFLMTALYMLSLGKKKRLFIFLTGVVALSVLFLTGSRSNTGFALPLIMITWLVLIPLTVEKEKRTRRNWLKGIGWVLLSAILTFLLLSSVLSEHTRGKLSSTFGLYDDLRHWELPQDELLVGEELDSRDGSVSIRKALLINGLTFLRESTFLGVGAGNVEHHMKGALGVKGQTNIHNWWGEVLVNFGVPIFLAYMAFYAWLLWRLFSITRLRENASIYPPIIRWGASATMLALIGYFFGGMSPSTAIHFTPMWVVYGFGLSIVVVAARLRSQDERGESFL